MTTIKGGITSNIQSSSTDIGSLFLNATYVTSTSIIDTSTASSDGYITISGLPMGAYLLHMST